ncbi:unnamed protein product, partial [Owenia fusiformis]
KILERPSGSHRHSADNSAPCIDKSLDRTWVFAVGDQKGALEFIDTDGFLKGFHIDLLKAICKTAGRKCTYVMDAYSNCWESTGDREFPGQGLLGKWYDACMGYWPSPRRLNSFNFTISYLKSDPAHVYYLMENMNFDPKDFRGRNIGFMDGWATNEFCLAKDGNVEAKGIQPGDYTEFYFKDHTDMVDALMEKKIDAFLSTEASYTPKEGSGVVTVGEGFSCSYNNRGTAFMTHYNNPVLDWLNAAMQEIYDDGTYRRICKKAQLDYAKHGKLLCLD